MTTAQPLTKGYFFQAGNTPTQWEINSVIIGAEMVQLDNTVANNFVSHLLQGGSLKMATHVIDMSCWLAFRLRLPPWLHLDAAQEALL